MIGWAAVSNSIPMGAMALGGILFSWQMPHFLSLAYMMRADYKAGGYLMMPGDAGTASLKRATYACIRHCIYLEAMCIASAMPASMGGLELVSPIFAVEATVLNAAFLAASVMLHRSVPCAHSIYLWIISATVDHPPASAHRQCDFGWMIFSVSRMRAAHQPCKHLHSRRPPRYLS